MKIFHFSDTHLGIGLENTAREEDFYTNFCFIIDEIIKLKPDVVMHSWDLFHSAKPSNKAISVVVESFLRLEKVQIPVIIIAGNHDTPRLSLTTHPFEIFESIENFEVFYKSEIKSVVIKNTNFVCLPHIHDEQIFKQELLKSQDILQENRCNIFISHLWLSAQEYDEYTDEISGINITLDELKILKQFDYVALGHYHKQFCIGKMCYPGSLEHTSFNAKKHKIGYNIFDTDTKEISHFSLPSRPMIDLWEIDCGDKKTTKELITHLEKHIEKKTLTWALVKITLVEMNPELILEFSEKEFLEFFKESFYFEYKKVKKMSEEQMISNQNFHKNDMIENFEIFFENYNFSDTITDKESLKNELIEKLRY